MNKKLSLIIAIFSTLVFTNCEKNNEFDNESKSITNESENFQKKIGNEYDVLGIVHNEALEYVKNELIKDIDSLTNVAYDASTNTIDKEVVFNYYKPLVNEFLKNKNIYVNGEEIDDFSMIPDDYTSYNSTAKNFYTIGSYDSCISNDIPELNCISEMYRNSITEKDNQMIVAGSIFNYSTIYWDEYQPITSSEYNWLAIGISDARGAFGWASAGAILGPGGVFGAGLAGGICESVANLAIQEIWNNWWD